MKSTPITRRAAASPLKATGGEETNSSSNSSSSRSIGYEADASGNVFRVDRTQSAGNMISGGTAESNVPQAGGGARATDPNKYIEDLKKRFPNATGQDLKDKGYISGAYVDQFPTAAQNNTSSTESSSSETRTPVMRPAEPGNKGMETDTRWAWQQRNINRTQNAQERQNRREARKDMKYLESEGLVQRTGKLGRGQGWALTEAGAADENAQAMFKANKRDIFGADRQRFRTDESGNVTGRSEAYDVQDSRKNRAQTGSYDPNDNYRAAKPEEQWNVNKHGEYGSGTTASASSSYNSGSSSSSSSSERPSSTSMFNNDAEKQNVVASLEANRTPSSSFTDLNNQEEYTNVEPKGYTEIPQYQNQASQSMDMQGIAPATSTNVPSKGLGDISVPAIGDVRKQIPSEGSVKRTMPSDYQPDISQKPIMGSETSADQNASSLTSGLQAGASGARVDGPTPSYRSHGNMEQEEPLLQMKYKHNPRMMYGDSPAKMWGAAKSAAQSQIVGNFKSATAGKPITKAASGPFKMKGYKK